MSRRFSQEQARKHNERIAAANAARSEITGEPIIMTPSIKALREYEARWAEALDAQSPESVRLQAERLATSLKPVKEKVTPEWIKQARASLRTFEQSESDFVSKLIGGLGEPFRFAVKCDPMGAPRQSRCDTWKPREVVLRYRAYCDTIRNVCGGNDVIPSMVFARAFIAMPDSWTNKKKREMNGKPHRAKPDHDNIGKGICDALMKEDGAVFAGFVYKEWCVDGAQRLEISLFYP